ncbi:hypothetical protein M0802_009211 [Mischocyttarus mexicanus]|nr:hypothetical protein M0802_009211 [Mischocyttarus mexicanus]
MDPTKRLKNERTHLKSRLTHMERLVEQGKLNLSELKLRYERLREQLYIYERSSVDCIIAGADETEFNDFDELADRYYAIGTKLNNITAANKRSSPSPSRATTAETQCLVNLPRVDVPTFDGDLEFWPSFKECFLSLIDGRSDISEIEKLNYLRSVLKGSPRRLVESYRITAENYKCAWNALIETYDRPRLLIAHVIDSILRTEKPKDRDREGLQRLLQDTRARVNSLINLNLTPLMVITRVIERCLPDYLQAAWCRRLNPDVFPTMEDLYQFLNEELLQLPTETERRERGAKTVRKSPRRRVTTNTRNRAPTRVRTSVAAKSPVCVLCRRTGHPLHKCRRYQMLTRVARWNLVRNHKLCRNCLRRHSEPCRALRCQVCQHFHHVTLHKLGSRDNSVSPKPSEPVKEEEDEAVSSQQTL